MSSAACHVSWVCNRFPTNDAVHSSERNFQSYRKNFKHALESQRLANPIRPHPHAATTQKTAEPVPPCTAARRGNYGNAVLATTGGQERAGCLRMENGKKTAAASNKQTVLQAADTPPVPVRMWSEHAFHNSPAAPPCREGPAPPFSSPTK